MFLEMLEFESSGTMYFEISATARQQTALQLTPVTPL